MRGSATRSGRGGWREGTAPSRSRQTGRETLASSGLLLRSGAEAHPRRRVGQASSRSPRPLLQGHYSPFIATTPRSAPVRRIRYSRLRLRPRRTPVPSVARETTARLVPEFRPRAHTTLTPPLRRTPPGQERDDPPGFSQGRASTLVLMSSTIFRRVVGRFAFARLRGAHLTEVPPPFAATLKTPALNRRPLQWFGTPSLVELIPEGQGAQGSFLHLLDSIASATASAFTAHRPRSS